ncbi:MAG: CDP-diacylglycerol--serine O-phosphatidyltransferase [Bdellovibrionaceae bacterium]|nr:CDP-diacylglycerol--serine O-phosphatidyltransferase [Pseudobdellovibrionaceae bacterium]
MLVNSDPLGANGEEFREGRRLGMYIYVLPNLMTTGNIFCGFFSVIMAIKGNFLWSAYAVVAAAIFDQLDGRLARLTRSTSKFGAEYDSLCDVISFGMAPAILLYFWALEPFGRLGWAACFLFLTCGALRLARFNVQAHVVEKNYFQGLPIPMAGGIVASAVVAFQELGLGAYKNWFLLMMTITLAMLMVSTIRFRSFKDLDLKERLPFRYLVAAVGIVSIILLWPEVMIFLLFLVYAATGILAGVLRWGKKARNLKPSVYLPAKTDEQDLQEEPEDSPATEGRMS